MSALVLSLLLAVGYAVLMMRLSVWRTRKVLEEKSTLLRDPRLKQLADRMAGALGVPEIEVRVFEIEQVNGLASPDGRIYLTRGFLDRRARGEVTDESWQASSRMSLATSQWGTCGGG